jgi:UDP-N-acetylglucosamine 2-epimerase (non-hydrolysing)
MKLLVVAGARPNFMKIASIIDAIQAHNQSGVRPIDYVLVHTGQHYDERMSQAFFRDLDIPKPHFDLEVGSSSHALQTAEIMKRFEPVLLEQQPDVVLVVGDVNSTVACSLVASKVSYAERLPKPQRVRPLIAHVEAGLRSSDRSMPEEINRIVTDTIADLLFITEEEAKENLIREGVPSEKIYFVGNTMVDTLLKHRHAAQSSGILSRLGLKADSQSSSGRNEPSCREYGVVTLHRPSNVDDADTFRQIVEALAVVAERLPLYFPVHPRTMNRINESRLESYFTFVPAHAEVGPRIQTIHCLEPLGYLDFLCLMSNAKLVLTDSGGIQEETTVLGVPCVTLRKNTERPVTIRQGTNVLAGIRKEDIVRHALSKLNQGTMEPSKPKFWDGNAGRRIVGFLSELLQSTTAEKIAASPDNS